MSCRRSGGYEVKPASSRRAAIPNRTSSTCSRPRATGVSVLVRGPIRHRAGADRSSDLDALVNQAPCTPHGGEQRPVHRHDLMDATPTCRPARLPCLGPRAHRVHGRHRELPPDVGAGIEVVAARALPEAVEIDPAGERQRTYALRLRGVLPKRRSVQWADAPLAPLTLSALSLARVAESGSLRRLTRRPSRLRRRRHAAWLG